MKRSTKLTLAGAAALAIGAAALPALSHDAGNGGPGCFGPGRGEEMMQGPGGGHRGPGQHGRHGHHGAGPMGGFGPMAGFGPMGGGGLMAALAEDADSNGDGIVSPDELRAALEQKLAEYDGNGDGTLSLDEFEALHAALIRPLMVDRFQALDEDGDGKVTAEEIAAPADRMERMMKLHERFGERHGRGMRGGHGAGGPGASGEGPGGMTGGETMNDGN